MKGLIQYAFAEASRQTEFYIKCAVGIIYKQNATVVGISYNPVFGCDAVQFEDSVGKQFSFLEGVLPTGLQKGDAVEFLLEDAEEGAFHLHRVRRVAPIKTPDYKIIS